MKVATTTNGGVERSSSFWLVGGLLLLYDPKNISIGSGTGCVWRHYSDWENLEKNKSKESEW